MSAPAMHSDRPLWIVLLIDAAVTTAAALIAPSFFIPELRGEAAWNAALIANFVVWSGVAMVGFAGWLLDWVESLFAARSRRDFTPAVPDAMHEIIAAPRHEPAVRTTSPALRITRDAAKQEERELETQNA